MRPAPLLSAPLQLAGRLDARCFALLQAIADTGSLQQAARTAGYSYKGAWLLLETAGNLLRTPLLARQTGGRGGGGSRLSPQALQLLAAWQALQQRHQDYLRAQQDWLLDQPGLKDMLRRLTLKATARNQFTGRVVALQHGPVSSEVEIDIGNGQRLHASVLSRALADLALQVGGELIALVKASDVMLVLDDGGYRLSAPNQLSGHVARIQKGSSGALVVLTLAGGSTVTASVTSDAVDALGLTVGQAATAAFNPAALMLAV